MNDFKTAGYMRDNSLSETFRNRQFANLQNLKSGLAVSYLQGLSDHFDFSISLTGAYLDYTLHNGTTLGKGNLLLETDASLIGKIFSDKHLMSPFLVAGAGASKYNNFYGIIIPLGTGLQVNFSDEAYLLINMQYRIAGTNKVNDHFYYSIGLAGNIKKKKQIKTYAKLIVPTVQSHSKDSDSLQGASSNIPDLKSFHGSNDSDGDGIPDFEDNCPTVPGVLKYHGCPIPDTDGDGINDENDSCLSVPGVLKYHGCPVPDSDGDGINDEEDKCPLEPGLLVNNGCPVLNAALKRSIDLDAQNMFFRTGSYDLLPQSVPALNNVANMLKSNPSLQLLIEGYTDNVGTSQKNQILSERRAQAVLDYLVLNSGISKSRLSAKGYGLAKPIASNKTAEGRTLNRRVELKLSY